MSRPSEDVEASLHNDTKRLEGVSNYSEKGIEILKEICRNPLYSNMSLRKLGDALHISKDTVARYRANDPNSSKKPGPDPLIPEAIGDKIEERLKLLRSKGSEVSLQTVIDITASYDITIHESTAWRFLEKRGWRSKTAQVRTEQQMDPNREAIIGNFLDVVQKKITQLKLSPSQFHVMDETAIFDGDIPKTTYVAPDEKGAYILGESHPTRNTLITTITANGGGHLFFVKHRNPKYKKDDQGRQIIIDKGCRGAGIQEIKEWAKSFVTYAHPGDLLLLDNLQAHKNPEVIQFLEEHGINIMFFPVKSSDELSPLDNSFFALLKRSLRKLKFCNGNQVVLQNAFQDLIDRKTAISMFKHCGYSKMFDDFFEPRYFKEKNIKFASISDTCDSFGILPVKKEKLVHEQIPYQKASFTNSIFQSFIPSLIHIFFHQPLARSIILEKDESKSNLPKIFSRMQRYIKISLRPYLQELTEEEKNDIDIYLSNLLTKFDISEFYYFILDEHYMCHGKYCSSNFIILEDQYRDFYVAMDHYFNKDKNHFLLESLPPILVIKIAREGLKYFEFPYSFDLNPYLDQSLCAEETAELYSIYGILVEQTRIIKTNERFYALINHDRWLKFVLGYKGEVDKDFWRLTYSDCGIGHAVVLIYTRCNLQKSEETWHFNKPTLVEGIYPFPQISFIREMQYFRPRKFETSDQINKEGINHDIKDEMQNENEIKQTLPFIIRNDHLYTPYRLQRAPFRGISNQGATCHLNSVIQLLFGLDDIKEVIIAKKQTNLVAHELCNIFRVMDDCNSEHNFISAVTDRLTNVMPEEFKEEQDSYDTLIFFVEKLGLQEFFKVSFAVAYKDNTPEEMKTQEPHQEEWLFLADSDETLMNHGIHKFMKPHDPNMYAFLISLSNYVIIRVERLPDCPENPWHKTKRPFLEDNNFGPLFAPGNVPHRHSGCLVAIIAYHWHHYALFKKQDTYNWILFDDEMSFKFSADHLSSLFGDGSGNTNYLWDHCPRKWVARLLIYRIY